MQTERDIEYLPVSSMSIEANQGRIELVCLWFAGRMQAKIADNKRKGDWKYLSFQYLYERFREESEELRQVLSRLESGKYGDDIWESVIQECIDTANFSMMIADKMRQIQPGKFV